MDYQKESTWQVWEKELAMNGAVRRCKHWLRSRCRRFLGIPVDGLDVFRDLSHLADLRAAWLSAEFVEERMASARPLNTKFSVLDCALTPSKKRPQRNQPCAASLASTRGKP
jgi:hypothetical protein